MKFTISRLASVHDWRPTHEVLTWSDIIVLLSTPRRSPCTRETCPRSLCPHRQGPCWSPANFTSRLKRDTSAISLLVFDVDQATDDQIDDVRRSLVNCQYLAHSTHSDGSSQRSLRFVLPLSRALTPDAWTSFWPTARRLLAPIADPACSDPMRIYFLPSHPHDATCFLQVNAGTPLDVNVLLKTISPSQVADAPMARVEDEAAL